MPAPERPVHQLPPVMTAGDVKAIGNALQRRLAIKRDSLREDEPCLPQPRTERTSVPGAPFEECGSRSPFEGYGSFEPDEPADLSDWTLPSRHRCVLESRSGMPTRGHATLGALAETLGLQRAPDASPGHLEPLVGSADDDDDESSDEGAFDPARFLRENVPQDRISGPSLAANAIRHLFHPRS